LIEWIILPVVLAVHDAQLAEHGGLPGLRDKGLLESAIGHPPQLSGFSLHTTDIATLAASYAFRLARNHAFVDGNKRTSAVVSRTFLRLNGHDFTGAARDQATRVMIWIKIAEGTVSEFELASWFRANIAKL
jgi:death-on-curing protein